VCVCVCVRAWVDEQPGMREKTRKPYEQICRISPIFYKCRIGIVSFFKNIHRPTTYPIIGDDGKNLNSLCNVIGNNY